MSSRMTFEPRDMVLRTKLSSILDQLTSRALAREMGNPYYLLHPCPAEDFFSCDLWRLMALAEVNDFPRRAFNVLIRTFIALYADGCGPEIDRLIYRVIYGESA